MCSDTSCDKCYDYKNFNFILVILYLSLLSEKRIGIFKKFDRERSLFQTMGKTIFRTMGKFTYHLQDVYICSIDGLSGFEDAIKSVFPNADIQRCVVHQIRNCAKYVTHADKKEFCTDMKPIYKAVNKE